MASRLIKLGLAALLGVLASLWLAHSTSAAAQHDGAFVQIYADDAPHASASPACDRVERGPPTAPRLGAAHVPTMHKPGEISFGGTDVLTYDYATRAPIASFDTRDIADPAQPAATKAAARGRTETASVSPQRVRDAANTAPEVISGTNARGLVNSRGSFRKATLQDAWDNAAVGSNGGRLCPTCGGKVSVPPHTGVPRDWDGSHSPSWSNREFPSTISRSEVLDNYNQGVSLECPICNRVAGNNDARFWP